MTCRRSTSRHPAFPAAHAAHAAGRALAPVALALMALTTSALAAPPAAKATATAKQPAPAASPATPAEATPAVPVGTPPDVAAAKALPLRPTDQVGAPPGTQLPPQGAIDITSDDPMEWHDDQLVAIARGNVVAIRGDDTLRCDTLVAYFRKTPKGETEFYRLAADGHVILTSPSSQAFGDHGVYDSDKQVTVLTGHDLHMVTRNDTIYAKDTLEYWQNQQLVVGRGDSIAINEKGDRLRGDVLVGVLQENAQKQLEMIRVDAKGHVVVVTPKDIGRGDEGTYNVRTRVAILTGDVRLTQGLNQINGHRAEMNFATQISRMLAGPTAAGGHGRVHSILVPHQKNAPPPPTAPSPGGKP